MSLSSISTYTTVSNAQLDKKDDGANQSRNTVEKDKEKQTPQKLTTDEERVVRDLQSRDSEVKAHEAAHQAAGGGMTGAATYTYQQGPDGKMYAIGGEVSIATAEGSTPQEKIANARQVAAAAMAPANPSPQDYAVASSARVMEMKAQQELAKLELEKVADSKGYDDSSKTDDKEKLDIIA